MLVSREESLFLKRDFYEELKILFWKETSIKRKKLSSKIEFFWEQEY